MLGEEGALSTAGLIVDDRVTAHHPGHLPLAIAGGKVVINSYSAELELGSVIDVSGGVSYSFSGQRALGNAGQIEIRAGQDPNPKFASLTGGGLTLQASLRGFSGASGGDLTILAPLVQIGGAAPASVWRKVDGVLKPFLDFNGTLVDPKAFLLLSPEFFSQGGFKSFAITGLGLAGGALDQFLPAVTIAPGTILEPRALSLVALPYAGKNGGAAAGPTLLPQPQRSPVSLAFTAKGVTPGARSPCEETSSWARVR